MKKRENEKKVNHIKVTNTEKIFRKNINALYKTDPFLAEKIKKTRLSGKIELNNENSRVYNLFFKDNSQYFYEKSDPLADAEKIVEEFNLNNTKLAFFLGLGLGYELIYFYKEKAQSQLTRYICVVEKNPEIFKLALMANDISAILSNKYIKYIVGDDDVLNALSLTTIQDSENNTFSVDVTNAHTGKAIATDVELAKNELTGIVHENVDVEFAANTGVSVSWNESANDFRLTGGEAHTENTFVHLADRTMVLHIGANQKQDIGTGIGNMGSEALGVDNIQVTSNPLANDAIGKIDDAISRVSGERSKLGAVQNRLDHTINNLGVTMENLTAAESRIRDADMAKEMMEFTKLQILSQSANAMLSQANQLPNNVLQLLR